MKHPFATDSSGLLADRSQVREHFARMGKIGLEVSAYDVVVHETADPEVVVAEFTYRGRVGKDGELLKLSAIFVLKVRGGQIAESRDYLGQRQLLKPPEDGTA